MSDWPKEPLGPYCQKIGSGATPRGGSKVYMDSGEIRLIRSQNVYNDGFKPGGLVFIDETAASQLQNVEVFENDVLLNITGDSVARACIVDSHYLPARVNQHVAIIRPNPDEFDPKFIRYFLVSPSTQALLLTLAGSGATRNALTKGMIESLELPKPAIDDQRVLANKLWLLDQKIKLNHQINQTLEQIAQVIFKSWFVDFEPVKAKQHIRALGGNDEKTERAAHAVIAGAVNLDDITAATDLDSLNQQLTEALSEKLAHQTDAQREQLATTASHFPDQLVKSELGLIPAGWELSSVGQEFDLVMGQSPPGDTYNENGDGMPFFQGRRDFGWRYPANRVYCTEPKRLASKGDTLLSVRAPVGDVNKATSDCCIGRGIAALRHKSGCEAVTYYSALNLSRLFESFDSEGTVFGSINQKNLKALDFVAPSEAVLECF